MTDRLPWRNGGAVTQAVRGVTPLFGRESELGWLNRCLEKASAGEPQVVLLVGEAGIGKTRVLREIAAVARARGFEVCAGRGYEERAVPFLPMAEALAPRLRALPAAVERALGSQAEVVRRFVEGDPDGGAVGLQNGSEEKLRLFLALSHAVIEVAKTGPMLLVLDDMHWVDQSSLELFAHIVFALADSAGHQPVPLMVVGASRPFGNEQQLARTVARLQREAICHTLELSGLGEADVQALMRGLGLERPSHQLVAAVNDATRGNPLFVREVVYRLLKRGTRTVGVAESVDSLLSFSLPADVTGAIADRLRDLGAPALTVLTRAAVLGDPFTLELLRAATGGESRALLSVLDEAAVQGLVVGDGATYHFAHPLIRQVLYSQGAPAMRQHDHAEIADALIHATGEAGNRPVAAIAHHLIAAGPAADPATVLAYARQAGDQAFAGASWRDAARFYRAALAVDESAHVLTPRDRAKLHSLTGQACYRDQDAEPCLEEFDHALTAFAQCGDMRGHARALVGKTRAQLTLASVAYGTLIDPEPLRAAAERIAEADPSLCALLWSELAQVFWTARRTDEAEAAARRALETGQRLENDYICAEGLRGLWLVQSQVMQVREALASLEQGLMHARRYGDPWLESHLIQREPLTLTWVGRLDDAEVSADVAQEHTRSTHDWGDHSLAEGARTCVAVARGAFAEAELHARQALMMRQRSGYPWAGPTALPALACAHVLRGKWADAEAALALLAKPGEVFAEPGAAVLLMTYVFQTAVQAYAEAAQEIRTAASERMLAASAGSNAYDADVYSLGVYGALVDLADLGGAPSLAAVAERPLALAAERSVVLSTGWVFLIARALGVVATLARSWERAQTWFECATEQATSMRARPEIGRTALDYARMLIARGRRRDRSRAAELLERATGIFRELGMMPFLASARRLEAHLTAPPLAVRVSLSGREEAVLTRIAHGCSDAEIARELLIPVATATRTARHVLRKIEMTRDEVRRRAAPGMASSVATPSERPLCIIVFTDMQGSTELFQRLGDAPARAIMREHDAIVRGCLDRHNGNQLKHTGDGVMAQFASVTEAVDCAIAMQREIAQHNARTPERAIAVRIGINAGEPIAEDGQLFGTSVNQTARICAQARGGQILVADVIRSLSGGKEIRFVDRGWVSLRGLSERCHLYEIPW